MKKKRPIELLSPAKDLNCGVEAILHGADAVYIGAPKFSARAAAGNTVGDIKKLCDFAHIYHARVYVALNTILKDDELPVVERMVGELYDAGTDALIVQDLGITQLDIPPIPLHASTQMDNCTPEKVAFLQGVGFEQVVLARELSLEEIGAIHAAVPDVSLEAFVHGALCVSYSGRCYLSAAMFGRSANRGECAQCCRLPYTMVDAQGRTIVADKHLLSLRDMNRSRDLAAMLEAGISSFKIEGRLKDVSYVKNVTAYYRQRLDVLFSESQMFCRSSGGKSSFAFEPHASKSFNRGFTSYFLYGREKEIVSFDTPKSIGEPLGKVGCIQGKSFSVNGLKQIHNGDGLAFFNQKGELEGFHVNRVEADVVYPAQMPDSIKPRTLLYRNYDHEFEARLSRPSAERKIAVRVEWGDCPTGFVLTMTDETGAAITLVRPFTKEKAQKPQTANIRMQLSKLGNTPFETNEIEVDMTENYFVPSSVLNGMRREAVEKLLAVRKMRYHRNLIKHTVYGNPILFPLKNIDYKGNIYNSKAVQFFRRHGVAEVEPAFEVAHPERVPLMYTKHCLRYSMGWCPVYQKQKSPYSEPYFLKYKEVKLRLDFDCKHCEMLIFKD